VWWQWDFRLTSSLLVWMVFVAYLLVRKYGGPGSDKLAAVVALFGAANVPFVYVSVNVWRTLHPKTTVVPSLGPGMREPFWFSVLVFPAAVRRAAQPCGCAWPPSRRSWSRCIAISTRDRSGA
jgi:heme exporter protein C